jgi:ubiquinone/menaquinone biosynthesis C-methylase UbiE
MMVGEDPQGLSQHRFGRFAAGYVTSKAHAKGAELDLLIDIARPQSDWVVLDVATGGGHTALKFAPLVARVVATDITPKMLDMAKEFLAQRGAKNVVFEPADALDLPFEAGTFDLVTCRIAPHHFSDCARFVREGARVLKGGGLLLVQDHVLPEDLETACYVESFEKLRDPSHNRAYAGTEWVEMFRAVGLAVERTEQVLKRHEFLPWAARQGCSPETIEHLIAMVVRAPLSVTEWMHPRDWEGPDASFVGHHIMIAGRKG